MKPKLSLLFLLSFVFYPGTAQVPQGFNYQAIVRDGVTKQPIVSQPVLIRVSIEDGIGTDLYQETHSLSTDEFGIISIIVGQGTPWVTSDFNKIDWNDEPLSIKTEVQYPVGGSYTEMGTAPLMSVPYAMVADSLSRPLAKLSVTGETSDLEEALFEVKNKDGNTVFAVYNEGVRIYVGDGDIKGPKGGFAIGGFGSLKDENNKRYLFVDDDSVRIYLNGAGKAAKGGFAIGGYGTVKGDQKFLTVSYDSVRIYVDNDETDKGVKGGFAIGGYGTNKGKPQKLLTVSDDSVRIYINDAGKGPKGGFAIGGFDQAKGDGANVNFFNVSTDNTGKVSTAEPRILWYPLKNAFLAGQVLILDPDSVGLNSVATGFESRARGAQSQAMGYQAIARGDYSTAIGKNALARKANSFAFGDAAKAYNLDSYALGAFTEAHGLGSFAFGYVGRDSLGPTGTVTKALGNYSFAFGLGAQTGAAAEGAFAIGSGTSAQGKFSLAMGYNSTASDFSVAIGNSAEATSYYSYAIGTNAHAQAYGSLSLLGSASGYSSVSIGQLAKSQGFYSVAIGGYLNPYPIPATAAGATSVAIGYGAGALGTGSFAIGNGDYNAMIIPPPAIRSGVANADYSFAIGTNVRSDGKYSTAMGRYTTAQSFNSFVIGRFNLIEGTTDSWVDTEPLLVIGNGTSTTIRSNAFTVYKDGSTSSSGSLRATGLTGFTSGTGVEIGYSSSLGTGFLYAYDYSNPSYKPIEIRSGLIRPVTDNIYSLGNSTFKWTSVYATNGTIQTSDIRRKNNILPLSGGLQTVLDLNPVSFTWKDNTDENRHIGLIAQEVAPLVPEVVDTGDDPDKTLGINYAGLVPVLISAIKEQQAQIEELKMMISRMEEKIASSLRSSQ